MNIKKLKIKDLKFAEYNPRVISNEAMEGLKTSLSEFGLLLPIVVNKDGTIIGGHRRVEAEMSKGATEIECNVIDVDKVTEKKINITLNNKLIGGEFEMTMLEKLLNELSLEDKFSELKMDKLLSVSSGLEPVENSINLGDFTSGFESGSGEKRENVTIILEMSRSAYLKYREKIEKDFGDNEEIIYKIIG